MKKSHPKAEIYQMSWEDHYDAWKKRLLALQEPPYEEQWRLLDDIHDRCVFEFNEETRGRMNHTRAGAPMLALVHGLPGSGKTKALEWLAEYFTQVWSWEKAVHFVYLAPLNSMAGRIGGFTVHSWGEVPFSVDAPQGNMTLGSRSDGLDRDMSKMASKCQSLRFLFIDEAEALGAGIIGRVELNVSTATRPQWYKYRLNRRTDLSALRVFGGINLVLLGDFWQLAPVQGVSLRSNPFGRRATEERRSCKGWLLFFGPRVRIR